MQEGTNAKLYDLRENLGRHFQVENGNEIMGDIAYININ